MHTISEGMCSNADFISRRAGGMQKLSEDMRSSSACIRNDILGMRNSANGILSQ